MKKVLRTSFLLTLFALSLVLETNAQEAFPYLKKVAFHRDKTIFLKCPKNAKVVNKVCSALPKSHPMHEEPNPVAETVLLAEVKLGSAGMCYITFNAGPSDDPTFMIAQQSNPKKAILAIGAHQLYVNGGNAYVSGHTNNLFNERKKYTYRSGKFQEVKQPFYYVGLKTKTTQRFKLYADKNKSAVVASIPANYNIEVLVGEPKKSWLLIRTEFGLTGWVYIENMMNSGIEGIRYAGD